MEKIKREEIASYLDTTPSASETWALIGIGITSYGVAFNPQVTTEKWIINANANSNLDSYQKQGDVSQKCYSGDPVFEYINGLRRTSATGSDVETEILDIDIYDEVSEGVYNATKHSCAIAISNYMAEEAVIEYSVYYNGDPVLGTVSYVDEVPVFTETASI